jgi:FdhD protein
MARASQTGRRREAAPHDASPRAGAVEVPTRRHHGGTVAPEVRTLPDETPVAVTFNGSTLAVMMATPADIEDFACGFALSEGVIADLAEIEAVSTHRHPDGIEARVWLRADRAEALSRRRRVMAGPVGCGLCGIDSLEQANRALAPVRDRGVRLSPDEVPRAMRALCGLQPLRDRTRATHAAGFLMPGDGIVMVREDVGRHNALDKLIGALLRAGLEPARGAVALTSRLSVELVQKSALAGCATIIAASAPTAQALRVAEAAGITLVASARGDGFDVYSHPHRIVGQVRGRV